MVEVEPDVESARGRDVDFKTELGETGNDVVTLGLEMALESFLEIIFEFRVVRKA